jgi:16S rRNA (guanine527-N7)-methyltransferase
VKPSADQSPRPQVIGAQVGRLVADYLHQVGLARPYPLLLDKIQRLAELISLWGARINLTADPAEPSQLAFHIIDSLIPVVFAQQPESPLRQVLDDRRQLIDLGSGAGFPGLVLAAASSANFTLCESRRKRASFLCLAAAEMELKNVEVDSRRINPGEFAAQFDVVTARAFAAPPIFHQVAAAALKPSGLAILYANPGQALDLAGSCRLGLDELGRLDYSVPRGDQMVQRVLALWHRL